MKRFISTVLILSLVFSLCVFAYAESETAEPTEASEPKAVSQPLFEYEPDPNWQEKGAFYYGSCNGGFVITVCSEDGGNMSLDTISFDEKFIAAEDLPEAKSTVQVNEEAPAAFNAEDIRAITDDCDDFFVTTGFDGDFAVFMFNKALNEYKYVGKFVDEGVGTDENGIEVFTFCGHSYGIASSAEVSEHNMIPYTGSRYGEKPQQDVVLTNGEAGFYAYPGDYISVGGVYLNALKDFNHNVEVTLKANLLRETDGEWAVIASREVTARRDIEETVYLDCSYLIPTEDNVACDALGHYRIVVTSPTYPYVGNGVDQIRGTDDDWLHYSIYANETTLWSPVGIFMGLNGDALKLIASGLKLTTTDAASTRYVKAEFTPVYCCECDHDAGIFTVESTLKLN